MAKIRVNLLAFIAGRQTTGFHVLDSMWRTSRACTVAFNSPRPLPVGRRRPIRRQCLRPLILAFRPRPHYQRDSFLSLCHIRLIMMHGWTHRLPRKTVTEKSSTKVTSGVRSTFFLHYYARNFPYYWNLFLRFVSA